MNKPIEPNHLDYKEQKFPGEWTFKPGGLEKYSIDYDAYNKAFQEWKYQEDVEAHKNFISKYRFYLDRIVNHLEFIQPGKAWTAAEILTTIEGEIRKSESMDAPNKPGYERANND